MAEQAGNSDLILENREKLTVTGVRRVLQCNAESAAIETARGVLQLAGAQLNVTSLDLDSGEVKLTGRIDTVEYTAARTPGGFLSRLLRTGPCARAHRAGGGCLRPAGPCAGQRARGVSGQGAGGVPAGYGPCGGCPAGAAELCRRPERRGRAAVVHAGQRLSLRFWGRTASAACSAGTGTGAVLAGGGAAPAGPAGIAAAGSSPQKTGGAGQSAPHAKKKRKKTEKELAKHTAVVV